jgi:putative endonuclease
MKMPYVYLLASQPNGTLYVGVTSDLIKRVWQHRNGVIEGFSSKYKLHTLVWFEQHETMDAAIAREKQLKAGSRKRKVALIESKNPSWSDLYEGILQ